MHGRGRNISVRLDLNKHFEFLGVLAVENQSRCPGLAQATSEFQNTTNTAAVDIQRLRHLFCVFQPLGYVPAGPVFKKHLANVYMEDTNKTRIQKDFSFVQMLSEFRSASHSTNQFAGCSDFES